MMAEAFRAPGERMPIGPLGVIGLAGAGVASLLLWNRNASSFGLVIADNFGLFVNGNNVALVPGSNTPVGIDTVNLGLNSQFYINNARPTDPNPAPGPLLNTEMDGLTKVLVATATVTPGTVNHIKLAIADT